MNISTVAFILSNECFKENDPEKEGMRAGYL